MKRPVVLAYVYPGRGRAIVVVRVRKSKALGVLHQDGGLQWLSVRGSHAIAEALYSVPFTERWERRVTYTTPRRQPRSAIGRVRWLDQNNIRVEVGCHDYDFNVNERRVLRDALGRLYR